MCKFFVCLQFVCVSAKWHQFAYASADLSSGSLLSSAAGEYKHLIRWWGDMSALQVLVHLDENGVPEIYDWYSPIELLVF